MHMHMQRCNGTSGSNSVELELSQVFVDLILSGKHPESEEFSRDFNFCGPVEVGAYCE
jgi:hypothetical protein